MAEVEGRAKEPVSPVLAGPYGHPFHPILVTVPIGAWISSLVLDVGSHVDGTAGLVQAARWLVAIGVLGALAAATVGLLDLLAIPGATPARRTAVVHMSLNLAVTAAYAVNFAWRLGDRATATPWGQLVLSAASVAVLAYSGSLGGRLAYRYGVRVVDEDTQRTGFQPRPGTSTAAVRTTREAP